MEDLLWENGNLTVLEEVQWETGNLTVLIHQSLLRIHLHFLVKLVTSHPLSNLQVIISPNRDWISIPMK